MEGLQEYFYNIDDYHQITTIEVIWYYNAIQYLASNDASLNYSIELATDSGFELKDINSELLASLVQSAEAREEFINWINWLDELELFED